MIIPFPKAPITPHDRRVEALRNIFSDISRTLLANKIGLSLDEAVLIEEIITEAAFREVPTFNVQPKK